MPLQRTAPHRRTFFQVGDLPCSTMRFLPPLSPHMGVTTNVMPSHGAHGCWWSDAAYEFTTGLRLALPVAMQRASELLRLIRPAGRGKTTPPTPPAWWTRRNPANAARGHAVQAALALVCLQPAPKVFVLKILATRCSLRSAQAARARAPRGTPKNSFCV